MVLRVEFDQFPQTVKRVLASDEAYVAVQGKGALATATDRKGVVVLAKTDASLEEATMRLQEQGMEVFTGVWSLDGAEGATMGGPAPAWVAAVSYDSEELKPGLWIDAYGEQPTLAQVMRTMYDEFMA